MQYSALIGTLLLAASAQASLDSSQVEFLTKLVNDAKSNSKDYLNYFKTGDSAPGDFTSLAKQALTYKDEGYTTLVDSNKVKTLQSFATKLPWYNKRIGGGSSGSSDSSSESSSSSSSGGSSTSSAGSAGSIVLPAGAGLAAIAVALL